MFLVFHNDKVLFPELAQEKWTRVILAECARIREDLEPRARFPPPRCSDYSRFSEGLRKGNTLHEKQNFDEYMQKNILDTIVF
jgi:hypothetical protein